MDNEQTSGCYGCSIIKGEKVLPGGVICDGKAAILESTCPGEDCVHSGWISQTGRSVVCLPNRAEVRIEGVSGADDVDAVVQ